MKQNSAYLKLFVVLLFLAGANFQVNDADLIIIQDRVSNVISHEKLIPDEIYHYPFIERNPILITSDAQLNSSFPGSGTIEDPIIIEGYNISGLSGSAISITDTTFYFHIKNNILNGTHKALNGIKLKNVKHCLIINNTVINNNYGGIQLEFSENNNISYNTVYNNDEAGIELINSHNNTISSNYAYNNNWDGIRLIVSNHNNTISHNVAYNNSWQGIRLESSNSHNIILNNTVYGNREDGIRLIDSSFNIIKNNKASGSSGAGILIIENSNNNSILENLLHDNNYEGLAIGGSPLSHNNTVKKNIIRSNIGGGIGLSGNNTIITNNDIYNNKRPGIGTSGSNTYIYQNVIYNNWECGIYTYLESRNNFISKNDLRANNNNDVQACDQGQENTYSSNYYEGWSGSGSYLISDNSDASPLTFPFHLSSPVITKPDVNSLKLNSITTIEWKSEDLFNHSIYFTLLFSTNDGLTWREIATWVRTNTYDWNVTNIKDGGTILLKIKVTDSGGFESFSDSSNSFIVENDNSTGTISWNYLFFVITLVLMVVIRRKKK